MNPGRLIITLLLILLSCISAKSQKVYNLDFEIQNPQTGYPEKWFSNAKGYKISLCEEFVYHGNSSLKIESDVVSENQPASFLVQSTPITISGDSIKLVGYIKTQNVPADSYASLFARIDGASGILESDYMAERGISGNTNWQRVEIKLPLPKEAKTLSIGIILFGTGISWTDNLSLSIDGSEIPEIPLNVFDNMSHSLISNETIDYNQERLTEDDIDNLYGLCKVWGFLKYHHPAVSAGKYHWDLELLNKIVEIQGISDQHEIDAHLKTWIDKLGLPEVTPNLNPDVSKYDNIKYRIDKSWINDSSVFTPELIKSLQIINQSSRPDQNYYVELHQLGNPLFKREAIYERDRLPDPELRLLSLFRFWNIVEYFYPYNYLIPEDWDDVLRESIQDFFSANTNIGYRKAILNLLTKTKDSHATIAADDIILNNLHGKNFLPIKTQFIENKLVVVDIITAETVISQEIKVGDIITEIDRKPVEVIIKEKIGYTPGSNYVTQLRNITRDILRTNNDTVSLTILSDNVEREIVTRTVPYDIITFHNTFIRPQGDYWRFIDDSIAYVNLGAKRDHELNEILALIQSAKGVIIDLRNYPSEPIIDELGHFLMPERTQMFMSTKGSVENPGTFRFTDSDVSFGTQNPEYFKGQVVVLINENTQSMAESFCMALECAPKVTVIGSTTAAANGNISVIELPGGVRTMISGLGIYYPDGRETQQIGILPDIEVKPTIDGIRNGKDEILEAAISYIRKLRQ
jgi:C-terminal processing protease CtpA/Prc